MCECFAYVCIFVRQVYLPPEYPTTPELCSVDQTQGFWHVRQAISNWATSLWLSGNLLSASSSVPGTVSIWHLAQEHWITLTFLMEIWEEHFLFLPPPVFCFSVPLRPVCTLKGSPCAFTVNILSPLYLIWAGDFMPELCLLLHEIMAHRFLNGCFQLANIVNRHWKCSVIFDLRNS